MLYIDFEVTWIRVTSCTNTIGRVKKLIIEVLFQQTKAKQRLKQLENIILKYENLLLSFDLSRKLF